VDRLDGMFSFVLLDTRDNSFIVARDAIGITSLYIGWGLDGNVSENLAFSPQLFLSHLCSVDANFVFVYFSL
jgi:asparagine synthetase B (glutamine-hydrolysing)